MARFYTYVNPAEVEAQFDEDEKKKNMEKSNPYAASEMSKSNSCFGYPLSIFFIVVNEFCERFSYYGMKAILILYFTNFISWNDNLSTAIYHTFVALCYLTPILGALIADSWLGKFKTIVSLSIVYTIGQIIISISSISDLTDHNRDGIPDNLPTHIVLSMMGLALIALGTGGIKPCVSAFGGDQFEEDQEKQRNRFFSMFYLAINAGSLLSTIITPMLRVQQCGIYDQEACYPLAFGVPAALMAVSLSRSPATTTITSSCGFIVTNERLICQIKMVTKVMFLYIPLPMFWALFDQQGSRWTLQATTMNGKMGAIEIQPDQMQTVNPILIVIMVPIFDGVLYPLIAKCGFNFTSLRRMTAGMFLAAMAFVVAALVQVEIDWAPNRYRVVNDSLNKKPDKGENGVRFVNTFNELISVTVSGKVYENITSYDASQYQFFTSGIKTFTMNSSKILPQCPRDFQSSYLGFGSAYTYVIKRKDDGCAEVKAFEDIPPNTVNMALQIPQYFLITCGEVVFSITGLKFSYSQAPSNMKSVLQAGWLLTVAVGNIIVLIVAGAGQISQQWAEYILFAALLLVVCVIFAIMARFYTYVNPAEVEVQFDEDEKKKNMEKSDPYAASGPDFQTQM
ncbi:solute carrier family 15 member 1-like [Otolemur garnettii]|uniref:solute carrier family 15 member 1-like n=1 Tax=Otolemur garnettii TaxID=30611 RepID=UPI000C7F1EAD|nr:solute carrier family 15 member 1-like [Otolemur garnettii]